MRVLTWNLFHGRAVPGAGRELQAEFAAALAGWAWDVALLQEVPPWWPDALARRLRAQAFAVLTSRNAPRPGRRWLGQRAPDLARSSAGGANAILVRAGGGGPHRALRLTWRPERRLAHAVRLAGGAHVVNLHASTDARAARAELAHAAAWALAGAGGAPLVLGGDLNLPDPVVPGFVHAAGHHVDHVLARGLAPAGPAEVLDRGRLSDHPPVAVELRVEG